MRKNRVTTNRGNLLAGFELRGDQSDFVDPSAAHDVNRPGDLFKQDFVVALHESHFLRALLENLLHARAEAIPSGIFVIDFDFAILLGDFFFFGSSE